MRLILLCLTALFSTMTLAAESHLLRPGDVLEVRVYNHPELEDQMPRQTLLVYGELSQDMVSKEK